MNAPRLATIALCWLAALPAHADPAPASHVRMRTPRGPVHVWTPAGYDASKADLVIYVHGYYVTIDEAWRSHHLARQFAASGKNAMFVVCGAPSAHVEPVDWESLDELVASLPAAPSGRLIAIAHSGGHRTVRSWFASPKLDALVLLDASYGAMPQVQRWLASSTDHRLVNVSELTRPWADELHAEIADSIVLDEFPVRTWPGEAHDARVLHVRSKLGHVEMITAGHAIPMILRLFAR